MVPMHNHLMHHLIIEDRIAAIESRQTRRRFRRSR